jgi:hypothetical protein
MIWSAPREREIWPDSIPLGGHFDDWMDRDDFMLHKTLVMGYRSENVEAVPRNDPDRQNGLASGTMLFCSSRPDVLLQLVCDHPALCLSICGGDIR